MIYSIISYKNNNVLHIDLSIIKTIDDLHITYIL